MELAIFLPAFLWLLLIFALSFQSKYSLAFRILAVVVFVSFVLFWHKELFHVLSQLGNFNGETLVKMLRQASHGAFLALLWVWPVVLTVLLISRDNHTGSTALLVLSIFSLIVWGGYLYFGFHDFSQ